MLLALASARSAVPGRWWLPGGGIEHGETPTECLIREFAEETGLVVEPGALQGAYSEVADQVGQQERLHTIRLLYSVRVTGGALSTAGDATTEALVWHDLAAAQGLPLMPFVGAMLFTADEGVRRKQGISSPIR